ncbi:MAG: NFACT family protein [Lachnospiraceae bacterium]|nr:NFACT family protein [Lachnospiraceae bacterium]
MAFDGVTIAALAAELHTRLAGGRLSKIAQPEPDELLLTIKTQTGAERLLLSADAGLPLVYLTEGNKPSPITAPNFCMLLRKHIQNSRILSVTQPGLERILRFEIEHLDEMGDLRRGYLIAEIMGKHSNLIFTDEEDRIIDSIKHVSALMSSVREVLPGRTYFVPRVQDKVDLLAPGDAEKGDAAGSTADGGMGITPAEFTATLRAKPQPVYKAFYGSFTGISPVLAQELCARAGLDGDTPAAGFSDEELHRLYAQALALVRTIREQAFAPCIAYGVRGPEEYAAIPLTIYPEGQRRSAGSISAVLEQFYREKNEVTRMRQKSADLRHIVQTALERNVHKLDLQRKQLQDTEKRDTYRVWGELLLTYGYSAQPGAKSIQVENYYTNEKETIPLDPQLTAAENAQRMFDRYGKLKRTYEALTELTESVQAQIDHLESVLTSLDLARREEDLAWIREELVQGGYIRRQSREKRAKLTGKPYHYISSDGYDLYVGRNNLQNDELTFKFANGGDWWFHAKKMPGSHVILRRKGTEEVPDRAFEEAAQLAAYYSKGREQDKVEVDYVLRKEVKKPGGAKPGFVVYYTNYSMTVPADISALVRAEE